MTTINRETVIKLLDVVDQGLVHGLGYPTPGKMCVEAAVCYALGLPHGDDPGCVAPSLRVLKIALNDSSWSSNKVRAHHLRRLAVAQLGSKDVLNEVLFVKNLADLATRYAAESTAKSAGYAAESARHAARHAAGYSAKYAAGYAAESTAKSAGYAAESAGYVAESARHAAKSAEYAAESSEYDRVLGDFCEDVVKILIEMKAPGCTYLYLTEQGDR